MSVVMSMTGFASVAGVLEGGRGAGREFSLTMKSVNHRHLDLSMRLPMGMDALEPALRRLIKAAVRRGHVELTLMLEKGSAAAAVELDEGLLDAYAGAYRQAAARYGVGAELDVNALLRAPGVMSQAAVAQVDASAAEGPVLAAMAELLVRFNEARGAEGAALAADLRAGMEGLQQLTEEARGLREGAAAAEMARLRGRLAELLEGREVSEDRLLGEAAVMVARGDVEEELVRLRTHLERFAELLDAGGEVGRPLDFLLQEINREANTLLSKTGGSGGGLRLTEVGLSMKVGLERAREQVQNLE